MKLKTLAIIAASSLMSIPAFAVDASDVTITEFDTFFGTPVTNQATMSYSVNGTSTDVDSNEANFVVDRKVVFSLTPDASATTYVAGETASTDYTLQNNSNAPIDFTIPAATNDETYWIGTTQILEGETISLTTGDTDATTTGDSVVITVKRVIPVDQENGSTVSATLTLNAIEPDAADTTDAVQIGSVGDQITASTGVWVPGTIQTVTAADLALLDSTSGNTYVVLSETKTYTVSGAIVTLGKAVSIISDPINGTTDPKAIPGAVVKYTLTIENNGLASASGITISDPIHEKLAITDSRFTPVYQVDDNNVASPVAVAADETAGTITFTGLSVGAATTSTDGSGTVTTTPATTVVTFTVLLK